MRRLSCLVPRQSSQSYIDYDCLDACPDIRAAASFLTVVTVGAPEPHELVAATNSGGRRPDCSS